jgi:DNA-binding response OmpR family regulator
MKNILVIDPSTSDFQNANSILGYAGYKLQHCTNLMDANELAALQIPDLILIEMTIPNTSFFALMRELKNSSLIASVPVIAVSSSASDQSVASTLGASHFVAKPYVFSELLAAVQNATK